MLAKWDNKHHSLEMLAWDVFEDTISLDKKNSDSSVRLIFSNGAGSLFVNELPKSVETFAMLTQVTRASVEEVLGS
jgi:3-dehydroquinate synthetase